MCDQAKCVLGFTSLVLQFYPWFTEIPFSLFLGMVMNYNDFEINKNKMEQREIEPQHYSVNYKHLL